MNDLRSTPHKQPGVPRHWHLTRDIKPRGECAACDVDWAEYDAHDQHACATGSVTEYRSLPEEEQ
jgi:hypothetical protein